MFKLKKNNQLGINNLKCLKSWYIFSSKTHNCISTEVLGNQAEALFHIRSIPAMNQKRKI